MPIWFIQVFGLFLLVGAVCIGFADGKWLETAEGSSLALAMIFIGRKLAKHNLIRPNKSVQTTAMTHPPSTTAPAPLSDL
jgi:hypothetical protein